MSDCIFCEIAAGKIPAEIVFEDQHLIAFRDINPVAPHHYLIIPRRHIPTSNHFRADDAALLGRLQLAAGDLARHLGVADDGYRLTMNCNADGGQTVYHVHLHFMAGRAFRWPPG